MGRLADLSGHRAIARDQRRNHRFAERPVREHCFDENGARHSHDRRITDREDAGWARGAFKGAQFAKERTAFNIGKNNFLSKSGKRRPQPPSHDEIDVTVVSRFTDDPGSRRRLEPCTVAIENPAGFRIERFETGMSRKWVYDHHRAADGDGGVADASPYVKRLSGGRDGNGPT
jgi:hypothetical protein